VLAGAVCVPAYSLSAIAAACDVLQPDAGVELLSPRTVPTLGDDVVSPTRALPFSFPFFRAPQTHFSATSNGLLQFFPSAAGVGSNSYSNLPIPTASAPNGYAGPFWTDLINITGAGVVRTQTFGISPNRKATVEWSNMRPLGGDGTERLQFQVQVYETTNVIEFHYCDLSGPADGGLPNLATGADSTIGLETPSGDGGVQHSYNTAGSVSTSSGLRFTPQ
jgi:hypothetical protein